MIPEPASPTMSIEDPLDGEVHVWTALVPERTEPAWADRLLGCLSEDEKARHRRYLRAEDASLFLTARVLLRHALSRYASVEPHAWRFEAGPFGRPELSEAHRPLSLSFNVSHTGGLAACAVTRMAQVGLDVESVHRSVDPLRIARHAFAPREREELEALPERERKERFIELWTLKEAYAKARGLGLRLPLRSIEFDLSGPVPHARLLPTPDDDPTAWHFHLWRPEEGFRGALAVRAGEGTPRRVVLLGQLPL
jgi:4'-phosphopantetheinyl transferase